MNGEQKSPTLQVPHLAPGIAIDEDPCTMGLYLEVPTQTRRRRSHQYSVCSACSDGSDPSAPVNNQPAINVDDLNVDDDLIFDSPRLFTEMITLSEENLDKKMWKEAARWVRFEEDVEEGSHRWSKPRVSTLSLHSFFELRSFLFNGTVAFDVEGVTVEEILNNVLPNITGKGKLTKEKIQQIQDLLKCKYVHLFEVMKNKEVLTNTPKKNGFFSRKNKKEKYDGDAEEQGALHENDDDNEIFKGNKQFLKKLPEGTEAANILTAEVYFLEKPVCVFIRLKDKTSLGSLTEVSISSRFIFLLIGPMGQLSRYTEISRSVATLLSDEVFREVAYKGRTKSHILAGMDEFLDASTLLPPGEWDPTIRIEPPPEVPTKESRKMKPKTLDYDEEMEEERKLREEAGLVRSGRLFGGLINDVKRKIPWFPSDFKDAFSIQTIASFFFLYFACLTPIITFGGLLGDATGHNIAVMESLVAALICGVLYGLCSGQPLTILGSTGPVLVFESIVYDFCKSHEWDYLSFRLWIGIWAAIILLLLVAVDASALVCYITRFTEENFATLIALIFILKAIEKVLKIGHKYPMEMNVHIEKLCNCSLDYGDETSDETVMNLTYSECKHMNGTAVDHCTKYYPDVFLLSLLLFFATFIISIVLKNFKTATFFPTKVRSFISDFAVIITILTMTCIDMGIGINTPKLWVPSELKPTSASRGWLIFPFNGNPWWTSLVAVVPALLACILIFMDQQITTVIVNRKEHKLKKGGGYHLDLFILALLIVINSVMGLPWFVAATVLSINHINSLKVESECAAPGEKPQFLGVRENRVTHVLIFIVIGLSVFMTQILSKIPMAVLYGVFMYMGLTALQGIQFVERILIMFMPVKYQPDRTFLRKVPIKKVHLYTCIQLACLVVLWVVKVVKQTSILFPLMLVIMVGIRKVLDCVFTQTELKILDDALPEFTRKKKIEEEGEDENEGAGTDFKRERLMSIALLNGDIVIKSTSSGSVNFSEELTKSGLWSMIDSSIKPLASLDGSRGSLDGSKRSLNSSRRASSITSMLKNRRKSSIFGPIFAKHQYLLPPDETDSWKSLNDVGNKNMSRLNSKGDAPAVEMMQIIEDEP